MVSVSGPATAIADCDAAAPGSGPKSITALAKLMNPDPQGSPPGMTGIGRSHEWRRASGIGPPAEAVGPGVAEIAGLGVAGIEGVGAGPTLMLVSRPMTATPTTPMRRTATSATAQRPPPKRRPKRARTGPRSDQPVARAGTTSRRATSRARRRAARSPDPCRRGRAGEPRLERLQACRSVIAEVLSQPLEEAMEPHSHGRRRHPHRPADLRRVEAADEAQADDRPVLRVEPAEGVRRGRSSRRGRRRAAPSDRRRPAPGPSAGAGSGRSGAPRWRRPT